MGLDPEQHGPEVRAHLGVVPQQDNLDEELKVRDNLLVYGRYFGLPMSYLQAQGGRAAGVRPARRTRPSAKVDALSGGMKRRLTIARVPDQRTADPAPGRAHHRARPAGRGTSSGTGCSGSRSRASP